LDISWLSLEELKDEIRVDLRDGDATDPRWSDAEIYQSIKDGVRVMSPFVHTIDNYSLAITSGTYQYTLPDYVSKVISIKGRGTSDTCDWVDLNYWEQIKDLSNNYLYIRRSYGTWTLILKYERSIPAVPGNMTMGTTELSASATSVILTAGSDSVASRLDVYGYLKIDSELISHAGAYTASTHTLAGLTRGQHDTVAAIHVVGSTVSPVIEVPKPGIYTWLADYALGKLHRMRLTGVASADLAGDVTAMREYDAAAERNLRRIIPLKHSRVIFERPRSRRRIV
jgi:hypothetical protein